MLRSCQLIKRFSPLNLGALQPRGDWNRRIWTLGDVGRNCLRVSPQLPNNLFGFITPSLNQYLSIDQTSGGRVSSRPLVVQELGKNEYEDIAEETLQSLSTYFDEILEGSNLAEADANLGSGVLTINLVQHGIYVINKQSPNKQIWLSSPTSGPKRYDFINRTWIYKHDGKSLYELLNSEIPPLLGMSDVDFVANCAYGKAEES